MNFIVGDPSVNHDPRARGQIVAVLAHDDISHDQRGESVLQDGPRGVGQRRVRAHRDLGGDHRIHRELGSVQIVLFTRGNFMGPPVLQHDHLRQPKRPIPGRLLQLEHDHQGFVHETRFGLSIGLAKRRQNRGTT